MTKKDLTTLLVLFGGGWLVVLSVMASLGALPQVAAQLSADPQRDWGKSAIFILLALLPVIFYGSLGWSLIRKSGYWAAKLLAWGKIDGAEIIQGGAVSGLSPLLFSMVGLYFLLNNLPSFLLTAFRWLSLSAPRSSIPLGSDLEAQLAACKSDLVYYALTIAVAAFVLLRSAWVAQAVQRFSEREKQRQG